MGWMRRISCVLIALFMAFMVLPARSAEAWVLNGCKYAGTNPAIGYRYYSLSSPWQTAFGSGQTAWNSTSAAGYFISTPLDPTPNIKVQDYWTSSTWWGLAQGGCDSGGGQIWYNELVTITFNNRTADGLPTTDKFLIATHEQGHAYGLAHSSLGCGSNRPVMRSDATWVYDNCGDPYAPYPNDVAGVNAAY